MTIHNVICTATLEKKIAKGRCKSLGPIGAAREGVGEVWGSCSYRRITAGTFIESEAGMGIYITLAVCRISDNGCYMYSQFIVTIMEARSLSLYYNRHSICSLMVRYTFAIRGGPLDEASNIVLEEHHVDLSGGEQFTETYLRQINPKGQVLSYAGSSPYKTTC